MRNHPSPANYPPEHKHSRQASLMPFKSGIEKQSYELTETTPVIGFPHLSRGAIEMPYNMHYGLELGIVLAGHMRRFYLNHQMDVGAGQVWLCGMWEPHAYHIIEAPCEYIIMIVWPPFLANLHFEEMPNISWLAPFILPPGQRPQIPPRKTKTALYFGRQLKAVLADPSSGPPLWIRFLLLNIMLILYEHKPFNHTSDNIPGSHFFIRLNHVLKILFESRSPMTTAQAAQACGLSREIFSILFCNLMGIRFSEFMLRYRVNSAATHLVHTPEPIKSIALRFGFADSSHLYRCFQKYYHCTPGEYRQRSSQHETRHPYHS